MGSSFVRVQVASAKIFTLITTTQGTATLTPLGTRICDPQQEKAARVEAFLAVPLYGSIHEKFKSTVLPPPAGLEATIGDLGVAQKQRERARQVFQRSAQEAGFFQFGSNRLVAPAIKGSAANATTTAALGKLGGFKGGHARAAALAPEERRTIAQRAAKARWAKHCAPCHRTLSI
jgi:hypothetical protein